MSARDGDVGEAGVKQVRVDARIGVNEDAFGGESTTAFLVLHDTIACIEAPIDLDSLSLLGVAHVIDSYVVVLTPEECNSVELFTTAKDILSCHLSHALSNHPVDRKYEIT